MKKLASELCVTDRVSFFGNLEYANLSATIAAADLFVGSGTAVIEAAAQCCPAMIGIESIEEPYTYGFLSDIVGLSYNEQGINQPLRPMRECITLKEQPIVSTIKSTAKTASRSAVRAAKNGTESGGTTRP